MVANDLIEWKSRLEKDAPVAEDPTTSAESQLPSSDLERHQRCWDEPLCRNRFERMVREGNLWTKARLRAVSTTFSGAWLHALPVRSLGNLLEADALRIAVALRLGAPICEEHFCSCKKRVKVDIYGHHGLAREGFRPDGLDFFRHMLIRKPIKN